MELMSEPLEDLIRENERLKEALRSVARYAENATFGTWRRFVYNTANTALSKHYH